MSFSSTSETPGSSGDDGKLYYSEGLADATSINLEYLKITSNLWRYVCLLGNCSRSRGHAVVC